MKYKNPLFRILILLSLPIILGLIFGHAGAVRNIVTGEISPGVTLDYPALYTLFAPFFQAADRVTILSVRQHKVFWPFLFICFFLCRFFFGTRAQEISRSVLKELKIFSLFLAGALAFIAFAVLVPRPAARLLAQNPDVLVVDFHSHTSHSWDARKSFTPEKNLRWHEKAGFDACFITDHNVFDGSREGRALSMENKSAGIVSMRGEEVSLFQSHWVLLGIPDVWSNRPYDRGLEGIQSFLYDAVRSSGHLAIASLPEYWLYHWDRRETLADWGAGGFEIVNSAPIGLDFPPVLRSQITALCRERDRIVVGITDNHGWGSSVYVWNLVTIPGWRALDKALLEGKLLEVLKKEGFESVQVFVRIKAEPGAGLVGLLADPFLQIWEGCRTLPPAQAAASLAWIWGPWLLFMKYRARTAHPPHA